MLRKGSLSQLDINRIVDDIVQKEKEKGIINVSNLIEKILKKYMKFQKLIENVFLEDEEEKKRIEQEVESIKEEIYIKLSHCVTREYQDGLKDLIQPQREDVVYVVLNFNGPEGFYHKFYFKEDANSEINEKLIGQNQIINVEELKNENFISKNNEIKLEELKNELIERKIQTIEYIKLINVIYSGFDIFEKVLLEKIICQYAEKKAYDFANDEPNKYKILLIKKDLISLSIEEGKQCKFINKLYSKHIFFEFKYEDFLLLFLRLSKFFYGIDAIIEIDELNNIFVKFYGNEVNLQVLAETYKLNLQIKPYANYYDQLSKRVQYICDNESDDLLLSENRNVLNQQFAQMNHHNHLNFPPYLCYFKEKNVKFRRYSPDDTYHNCPNDPEMSSIIANSIQISPIKRNSVFFKKEEFSFQTKCCSNFRNIDKIRIILQTFEDKILFFLKRYGSLESVYILRNFKEYKLDYR